MVDTFPLEGNLEKLYQDLTNISNVIRDKAATGFPLLQEGEEWTYETHPELSSHVCYICAPLHGSVLPGDQLKTMFPSLQLIGMGIILPETHVGTDVENPCYCTMELTNSIEVLEARMHKAKLAVL